MTEKDNKTIAYNCELCKNPSIFVVDGIYEGNTKGFAPNYYSLIHCSICGTPKLIEEVFHGVDASNKTEYYKPVEVFPRKLEFDEDQDIPETVRKSYKEAIECNSSSTNHACAVMIGRTLETICGLINNKKHQKFQKGLEEIFQKGVISKELYDWANELRALRNLGAHTTSKDIQKIDIIDALDFLKAIIEIIYILRPKYNSMMYRKNKKSIR